MWTPWSTPVPNEADKARWEGQNAKGGQDRSQEKPVSSRLEQTSWQKTDLCDRDALRQASINCQISKDPKECENLMQAYKVRLFLCCLLLSKVCQIPPCHLGRTADQKFPSQDCLRLQMAVARHERDKVQFSKYPTYLHTSFPFKPWKYEP